jgi:hypothetical protein
VGVRLFRHYTPSGRALTAALGRIGHRARRKSCLGAGRLGQPSLRSNCRPFRFHGSSVHISQLLIRMIEMERAGVVGHVGVSLLPSGHRIRADTDTRPGRADPSLPAVATERLTSSFGHPHGSVSGRRAAARASPTAPFRVQRQWSVGARTSNRSTPIGPRRVPGDERVMPARVAAAPQRTGLTGRRSVPMFWRIPFAAGRRRDRGDNPHRRTP